MGACVPEAAMQNTIFVMAMALKATPALPTATAAVDGTDKVDLYYGNISPVASDFDDPLKWCEGQLFSPLLSTGS
jgi:hypothetical protein